MNTKKIFKACLGVNLATGIRALRFGPREAARRLVEGYDKIDPFGPPVEVTAEARALLGRMPRAHLADRVPIPVVKVNGNHAQIDGALPQADLMALLALLIDWNPAVVLEIGTFNGATTAAMALNAPGATIHTMDLPLDFNPAQDTADLPKDDFHLISARKVGDGYLSVPQITNVVQHFADSATWDFNQVAGASFFFIDGAHTYAYVKNDTEKCLSVAAPKARFLIHDCDERHPDVLRYVCELVEQGIPAVRLWGTALAYFDRQSI
jgi:hypothetical protein